MHDGNRFSALVCVHARVRARPCACVHTPALDGSSVSGEHSNKAARRILQLKKTRGSYLARNVYLKGAVCIDRDGPPRAWLIARARATHQRPSLPDQLREARWRAYVHACLHSRAHWACNSNRKPGDTPSPRPPSHSLTSPIGSLRPSCLPFGAIPVLPRADLNQKRKFGNQC